MGRLFLVLSILMLALSSCMSTQEHIAETEAQIQEEKLKIIQDYRECLKKIKHATGENLKCEEYRKAAEIFM